MLVSLIKTYSWTSYYTITPGVILLGLSFSLLIRLRKKYLLFKDVEKVIDFDGLIQFKPILINMVNASNIFNLKSPLFTGYNLSKIEALNDFCKALNSAYGISREPRKSWFSDYNAREYLKRSFLTFIDAGNKNLVDALNSSKETRLNVLYINRPDLSAAIGTTNLKKNSMPKRVSFFGDSQVMAKLDEVECKLNLEGAGLTCLGILKYRDHSDDLSLADKIDIEHFTEDLIRYLDAAIEENDSVRNSIILLEADDRVKFVLVAAINSSLMKIGYANRAYIYYDPKKIIYNFDGELENLLHQIHVIVANELSLQDNIANNFLIY